MKEGVKAVGVQITDVAIDSALIACLSSAACWRRLTNRHPLKGCQPMLNEQWLRPEKHVPTCSTRCNRQDASDRNLDSVPQLDSLR